MLTPTQWSWGQHTRFLSVVVPFCFRSRWHAKELEERSKAVLKKTLPVTGTLLKRRWPGADVWAPATMDSTMDLDQLAIMLVVLVVMGTVICTVGAVLSCFSRSHNESRLESRGIGSPNIPAWWRNVSGTADLDGYYTDEPDGFGLGLAGLRGQGAWDAAGTRSSFVSHDSDRVSRFIWEHQSPSSFRW